jgi:hypothetical protein
MKAIKWISIILVVIGALNWGLWGFFQFDAVAYVFGGDESTVSRVIYALVGLAGIYQLKCLFSCSSGKKGGCC